MFSCLITEKYPLTYIFKLKTLSLKTRLLVITTRMVIQFYCMITFIITISLSRYAPKKFESF